MRLQYWWRLGKNDLHDGEAFSISICSSPDLCHSRMQCGKFHLQYEEKFWEGSFFHRRPIERIGQLWIWFHISIRTFPKFPICSGKDFMQFVCLQVCGCLGQRGRERERVDPRRKLLIALVVLNCLQPLPKLSGEINIEKHYKIIFKKIQQHIRSADDRSWKDGIHGSDCSLKMSLYST